MIFILSFTPALGDGATTSPLGVRLPEGSRCLGSLRRHSGVGSLCRGTSSEGSGQDTCHIFQPEIGKTAFVNRQHCHSASPFALSVLKEGVPALPATAVSHFGPLVPFRLTQNDSRGGRNRSGVEGSTIQIVATARFVSKDAWRMQLSVAKKIQSYTSHEKNRPSRSIMTRR